MAAKSGKTASGPNVEKQKFANMAQSNSIALDRIRQVVDDGSTDREPFTLQSLFLSTIAAVEAPQVSGPLNAFTAAFTHGVLHAIGNASHDLAVDSYDDQSMYDSDDSSEDEENEATAGLDLHQKKVTLSFVSLAVSSSWSLSNAFPL